MTNLVTANETRNISGAPTSLIDDTTINSLITEVQEKSFNFFNITPTPVKRIEFIDGTGKESFRVNYNFPLRIEKLQLGEDDIIDLNNIHLEYLNNIVMLDKRQSPYYFYHKPNHIRISYLSGFMKKTNNVTENSDDLTSGSSVTFDIEDDIFEVDDWVMIEDFEGKRETVKVTAQSSGNITVDKLTQNHSANSILTKLETHSLIKDFILYESVLAVSQYAVGSTYTFNTSYSVEGVSVNKGVPYPHWEKSSNLAKERRNEIKAQIFNLINPMG